MPESAIMAKECSLTRDQPHRDVGVALAGAGGGVQLYRDGKIDGP